MRVNRLFLYILIIIISSGFAMEQGNKVFIHKEQWSKFSKGYDYTEHMKVSKANKDLNAKSYKPMAPTMAMGASWLKYLLWGFIILILLVIITLLIIRIFKETTEKVVNNKSFKTLTIEDIEGANLEDFLDQSLTDGSFKEAIRIKYLMLIRTLSRLHFVVWKKDKTNGTYLNEMHGKEGFELFRAVTLSFERAWYGEKEIGEKEYNDLIPLFDQLNKKVMPNE